MIVGVGIDMIEVARVEMKINKENGFRESIFSAQEINFCESRTNKFEHYAARFAAKEAFLKATGFGLALGYTLNEIEISNDINGKPMLTLSGDFKVQADKHKWNKLHVSLTHLKDVASAVVIIEQ
ncbi:MAG: holo-ACP synthase [Chryseolinea sp.]